jgi:hypothetical protein
MYFRPGVLTMALVVAVIFGTGHTSTETSLITARRLQGLVDDLKSRLDMPQQVTVALVPENALLVSVETDADRDDAFLLSCEQGFLDGLADDELNAVLAHELGHVWIFTHHPYLQTEQLANRIAMRLVSRESLHRVYAKVWERAGTKGDLARFLGN